MNYNAKFSRLFYKWFATISIIAIAYGIIRDIFTTYNEELSSGGRLPYSVILLLTFIFAGGLFILITAWTPFILEPLNKLRARLGFLRWILAGGIAAVVSWLFIFSQWSLIFSGAYLRFGVFLVAAALMAWLAVRGNENAYEWRALLGALVLLGTIFNVAFAFRYVSNYPFTFYWSEGNRFWDYSVLFGRHLYNYPSGQGIPAYIDLGRQSLWGLIFLLPKVSIAEMRIWSGVLFTIPYILLGWAVLRLRKQDFGLWVFFGLWAFLFLNQGPIYTPLVLAAILIVFTRRMPLWLAAILTIIASYYASITRYTWLFAPGIWAALLAFLETSDFKNPLPMAEKLLKKFTSLTATAKRLSRAIGLGLAGIFGGYFIPQYFPQIIAFLSGTQPISNTVSLVNVEGISTVVGRQPLLWDRLLPNPTYPLGIILGLLLAAGPLLVLLIMQIARRNWRLDRWQILALAATLAVFLGVGIVVSVKIGGGSNLHNLDMFLIAMLFATGLALETDWGLEKAPGSDIKRMGSFVLQILLVAIVAYPAAQNLLIATPVEIPGTDYINSALHETRERVAEAQTQGEVLFIDQRQLLTFGYIKDVPLIADYEKKHMMDLALAGDAAYFDRFYQDLAAHRFSLIVTEPLNANFQGEDYNFGSENDAWVKWVSIPVLCYYKQVGLHPEAGVLLLVPKEKSPPQEGLTCPKW